MGKIRVAKVEVGQDMGRQRMGRRKRLAFEAGLSSPLEMALPSEPVTLTVGQVEQLQRHLSTMRHDINNQLSLVMAAVELIRRKPQMSERMLATLVEQPPKVTQTLAQFTAEFERALGITRP